MWLLRAVVVLELCCALAVVPLNAPIQVVRPTSNHTSLSIVPEGLAALAQHSGNIALVSVVGPYHSGKSFLLNALLRHTQAFSVGKRTSPETMGMWICRTNMTAADGSEVWLMDSEGFFGPGVDEAYDAKVFTVASLVGAHVVYNTVKVIDQQAVGLLEMLIQRAQLFRTRSTSSTAEVPEFLQSENIPPLTWVVEDFVQELPERLQDEGATGWLRTYLESSRASESTPAETDETTQPEGRDGRRSEVLSKVYKDIRVHTLFLPATSREHLRDLSRLSWHELTEEFRTEVDDLRRHVLRSLRARQSGGIAMTGAALASALQFIVKGLQQGMFHELPSLWGTWTSQVAAVSLSDADVWFASLLQKIDTGDNPVKLSMFNERLDEAREHANTFYRNLLRNFDIAPEMSELRRRMEVQVESILPAYHDRIRRWVAEHIARAKDHFSALLAAHVLPTNPTVLERECQAARQAAERNFSQELREFAALPGSPGSGRAVHFPQAGRLPAFAPEPAAQLAADLGAQSGLRQLENERAIQQLFKGAVAAADDALVRELKGHGQAGHSAQNGQGGQGGQGGALLSKARLKALRKAAEERSAQVFEDRLAGHSWARGVPHYAASRSLLQVEHVEARLAAFAAANDQRLKTHFFAMLDRVLASYNANRSSIVLPAAEADIESEHARLATWTHELLAGPTKDLTDTDAFSDARSRLDAAMLEGYAQLREKNIELWKAHSDEATRCAIAANRAAERQCGTLCLFNTVPWAHQAKCRRHLSDCFARSSIGSSMAPALRTQVFKAWYSKDLAREAQRVQLRCAALLITFAVVAFGTYWSCCRRGARPSGPQGYTAYHQRQQRGFLQSGLSTGSSATQGHHFGCFAPFNEAHARQHHMQQPMGAAGFWRAGA